MKRTTLLSSLVAVFVTVLSATASAQYKPAPQPPFDRGVAKSLYHPIGFFKPGDAMPDPLSPPKPTGPGGIYNPGGFFNAYDNNVYEALNFPSRQADDESNQDPPGTGDPRPGFCAPDPAYPEFSAYGKCKNHQLEYLDYYEATMKEILGPFGVTIHRYKFDSPGSGVRPGAGNGGTSTPGGKSYNIAAVVAGADHPDYNVVVGAHYDFTDSGPAAAWDSSEGHAEVIRMAKIMADYWTATGTRPSATIKFMPWDQEESGTLGSQDYIANNVVPDQEDHVLGYFNVDPCAGAFPAFYYGNPAQQVAMAQGVVDPTQAGDNAERVTAFNAQQTKLIDEFWADIDDTVQTTGGAVPMPIYTDADRSKIVQAVGGLLLFGSDWSNFGGIGVPYENLFPDMFGPHAQPQTDPTFNNDGIGILHSPNDNLVTLNRMTGDPTGTNASDGWMKGMELCANLQARGMLDSAQVGHQASNSDPVAYFEALPNEAQKGKFVNFDAGGSYQYAGTGTRVLTPESDLQYKWDFGDGTAASFGKNVKHAYKRLGKFTSKLTLTNRKTGQTDTMETPITVEDGDGADVDPAGQAADTGTPPNGGVVACQSGTGFSSASAKPAGKGIKFTATTVGGVVPTAEVWQVSTSRKAVSKAKRVFRATMPSGTATYSGKGATRGTYFARLTVNSGNTSRPDVRSFGMDRLKSKFKSRKTFSRADSCSGLSVAKLSTPAWGGKLKLGVNFASTKDGKVKVTVARGKKVVKRYTKSVKANRLTRIVVPASKKFKRGEYKITIAGPGGKAVLYAKKY